MIIKPNYTEVCIPVRDADNVRYERMFRARHHNSEGVDTRRYECLTIGSKHFSWSEKTKRWERVVKVYEAPAKYVTFMVYGDFPVNGDRDNFFLVRIPNDGINWHKQVIPAIRNVVKRFNTEDKHPRWNIDSYTEIDETWNRANRLRFYWRGNKLVQKHSK